MISSLPFTISTSGTYVLSGNLTDAGPDIAITVEASNVVIDLKGFTLSALPTTNNKSFGIFVRDTNEDFAIQNGEITGFNMGLQLGGTVNVARNLKILACKYGITLTAGPLGFCEIQNCLIDGNGAEGAGVSLLNGRNLVQHCQIVDCGIGAVTENGRGIFIANSIFDCTIGLRLLERDKYQGNVTNGCTTPFSGGTAVGDENN